MTREVRDAPAGMRFSAGSRLAPFAALGLPLALAGGGGPLGVVAALAYDGLLVGAAALEARSLARRTPVATRVLDARLVVGAKNRIVVRLHNPTSRGIRVTVRDELPDGWVAEPEEQTLEVPAFARREIAYDVVPPRRGRYRFGDVHLRLEGAARLGAALVRVPAAADARVYPNVLGPRRFELAARLGDLRSIGFRNIRVAGQGGEFEQLREYVAGDAYRELDWKSTA